jgi:proline racemase
MTWTRPDSWQAITTIDAHAAGEPLRVITGGLPPIPGETMLARRRHAQEQFDWVRRALMWEPRGHADMYGAILTPPVTAEADRGVLFLHNDGFSTMCGHGVIALVTVLLETGLLSSHTSMLSPAGPPFTRDTAPGPLLTRDRAANPVVTLDTPAGTVRARARLDGSHVVRVAFENVPAFAFAENRVTEVPGVGTVRYDVAFGGAYYAFCDAGQFGLGLEPSEFRQLIEVGVAVKRAVVKDLPIRHPGEEDLGFLYGTILTGSPRGAGAHSRHVCVFADGEVDRSPTGTGVSARLALLHARGELPVGGRIVVESLIGTRFAGRVLRTTTAGDYPAIVPEIEGSAHITGRHEFLIDPADPLREGFILR